MTETEEQSKIEMSSEWHTEERKELVDLLNGKITELDTEEQELRKTIHYEAPCFREIEGKRGDLERLRFYAGEMDSSFLELNRRNYSAHIA